MVKYDLLGFKSLEEYIDKFMNTLLYTNKTYNFFVDWNKVREHVKRYIKEINLLNSLTKVNIEHRRKLLKEILIKYPETVPVLPLILAVRDKDITILEVGETLSYKKYSFYGDSLSPKEIDELVVFADKTGILDLMGEISDLYAYLMGVEVGLDTNTRKNRSGKIFQELVKIMIKRALKDLGDKYKITLREEISVKSLGVSIRRAYKRIDFALYLENQPRIVIECNFYNVSGSKPIEVAEAYVELNSLLGERNIPFIWITDGPAWRKMKNELIQAMKEIDYVLNLKLTEIYLKRIVKNMLKFDFRI